MIALVQCVPRVGRVISPPSSPASSRSLLLSRRSRAKADASDIGSTPREIARKRAPTFACTACAAALAWSAPSLFAATLSEIPVRYWDLPTGSHLAYVHVPAPNPSNAPALVFVHGGPGACQVYSYTFARAWYERVAALGFNVYLYDQIGGGYSARLANPLDYTTARHLADLEAIRRQIGTEHLVLIGESHGASLAAAYLADHPARVAGIVFVAPGAIEPAAWKARIYPHPTPRVAPEILDWIARTRGPTAWQRYAEFDALLRRDVRAAYAFSGDTELDPLMDAFVNETILATCVHDPARLAERHFEIHGMGWWASVMTTWNAVNTPHAVRSRCATTAVPVLILRGDSDYLPSEIADEYAATFRRAKFIRVPAAGHFIWMDQPERYRDEILAFLAPLAPAPSP